MKNKKWLSFLMLLIFIGVTGACSKKLLPPEMEARGSVSESSVAQFGDLGAGSIGASDFGAGGSGDSGSGSDSGSDSGFFREDNVTEMDTPSGPPIITGDTSSDFGSGQFGMPGGGESNSFDSPPFSGQPEPVPQREDIQEARLLPYRATSDLEDIHFMFDRYDLDGKSKKILKQNATFLKDRPNMRVEIQGHCDERGTNNYNIALGERRANSTKQYLTALGVDSSRIHVISYGEEKPFCMENNENCWWKNRRAHFLVAE